MTMAPYSFGLGQGTADVIVSSAPAGIQAAAAASIIGPSTAAWAVPVAGAVATVGLLVMNWIRRRNAQKVAATHVVDEAEPYLERNRQAFLSLARPSEADREAALSYFDAVWGQVRRECQAIGGGGGERCVSDREPGGPWDWFAMYRTPIEQAVTADTAGATGWPTWGEPAGTGPDPRSLLLALSLLALGATLL